MEETYDFIVVGSGPSGSTLASLLSHTPARPSILLLEAGDPAGARDTRLLFDRFTSFMTQPHSNWGYTTAPQAALNNREIEYSRGKGLGGSSVINFACWTKGPREDWDEWARVVGDERWGWEATAERWRRVERVRGLDGREVPEEVKKYVDLKKEAGHGTDGPLDVEVANVFEQEVTTLMDAVPEMDGWSVNRDLNDGDPIGVGVTLNTAQRGVRVTAASAFLEDPPSNLTIKTEAQVHKVLLEGKKCVGVQLVDGTKYLSRHSTILSAGTLDTPKILLHSGIGPSSSLLPHHIPQLHPLPGVGHNLQDHVLIMLAAEQTPSTSLRPETLSDAKKAADARTQFLESGQGPMSYMVHSVVFGFLKHPSLTSLPGFSGLPSRVQQHLQKPTIPHWEFIGPGLTLHPAADPTKSYISVMTALMNPQSRGTVTLRDADPRSAPVADPRFLSESWDREMFCWQVRQCVDVLTKTGLRGSLVRPFAWPGYNPESAQGDAEMWDPTDAEILEYVKNYAGTEWHMSGTCAMGRDEDEEAVVDTRFRVRGLEGLRVVDLSVCPFVLNCHTVSTAYNVGVAGADCLGEEFGLREVKG